MSEPIYFINGRYLPKSRAKLSILDLGWLRGYGVFDYLVTYDHKPFLLEKHVQRLIKSAELIDLNLPWNKKELERIITNTLNRNLNGKEKSIRIIITGGLTKDALSSSGKPTLAVVVDNRKKYPLKSYTNGVKVILVDNSRHNPQAKSLDYIQAVRANIKAKNCGATEAIYINKKENRVYEGSTSNIFIVKNGSIFTPNPKVLQGVTREIIIHICKKLHPLRVGHVNINQLKSADEIFITATNKEVLPIVKLDKHKVAKGKVGPITKNIMKSYKKFIDSKASGK